MSESKITNIEKPKGGLGALLNNREAMLALGMGLTSASRGRGFNAGVMQGLSAYGMLSPDDVERLAAKTENIPVEKLDVGKSEVIAVGSGAFVPEGAFGNLSESERALASNLNFADAAFKNGDRAAAMKAYEAAAEIAKQDQAAGRLHPDTLELFQDFAAEYLSGE